IEEQRAVEALRPQERRHLEVPLPRLPQLAPLGLEPDRRQRAVEVPVARDPGLEERRVYHRVHGAERSVAMAAEAEALAVDDALPVELVDDGAQVVPQVGGGVVEI